MARSSMSPTGCSGPDPRATKALRGRGAAAAPTLTTPPATRVDRGSSAALEGRRTEPLWIRPWHMRSTALKGRRRRASDAVGSGALCIDRSAALEGRRNPAPARPPIPPESSAAPSECASSKELRLLSDVIPPVAPRRLLAECARAGESRRAGLANMELADASVSAEASCWLCTRSTRLRSTSCSSPCFACSARFDDSAAFVRARSAATIRRILSIARACSA